MEFAETFLERFHWIDGHADILGLLADGAFLAEAATALAEPFRAVGVTKVAGVEAPVVTGTDAIYLTGLGRLYALRARSASRS